MHPRLKRQLIDAIKQQTASGKTVRLPEGGQLFWSMFVELSNARTMGPVGPNAIQFSEIESWARLNRWPLDPRHVELIRAMDDAWIECAYSSKGLRKIARTPATPEALDAVFDAAGW